MRRLDHTMIWVPQRAPGVVVDGSWGAVRLLNLPIVHPRVARIDDVICGVWRTG